MMHVFHTLRKEWVIIMVILCAFLLRIWGLDTQSLWLDELHSMNEADPSITWREMFYHLKCCDQHPPLYFILERLFFTVFGHTAFVARIVSVLAGTASIWAVWLLGREILSRNLGLTLAIITAVNYYNLFYTQEARGYILAFLLATLSTVYLIRLIKKGSRKSVFFYVFFTLCLLYTHYFSLFIVAAHGITGIIMLITEKTQRERILLFKRFAAAFLIIVIGYLPWLPFIKAMSAINSFWIGDIAPDFLQIFFSEYFGNSALLNPILILLLIAYVIHVMTAGKKEPIVKENPAVLSFIIITTIIFSTYMIPYVRSLLVVPMLYSRYTIVALPFILLAVAYGIESFSSRPVKNMILGIFVICSLIHILWVKKHYTDIHKTQFRELTEYITQYNRSNYPVLNEKTSWHQSYYFKKSGFDTKQISGIKSQMIDSILHSNNPDWTFTGFWLAGAHGDPMLSEEKQAELGQRYVCLREKKFYDAWAQFYVLKSEASKRFYIFDYTDFLPGSGSVLEEANLFGIWSGYTRTAPFHLTTGDYQITVTAMGTDLKNEFPHLNLTIGDHKIGSYFLNGNMEDQLFRFHIPNDDSVVLNIGFDNDEMIEGLGDRNVLLQSVLIEQIQQ